MSSLDAVTDPGQPPPADSSPDSQFSDVFLHSRREAKVIFSVWVIGLLWAVPYCYFNGFPGTFDAASFSTTWGIPTWLFFGILVPWIAADIFTTWFCFRFMTDDDLGVSADEDLVPAPAETAETEGAEA